MSQDAFYSREELLAFGFAEVGDPVWISRKASLYAIRGSLGHHVRVDDFCILKGHLRIGNYIHIAGFCSLSGVAGVVNLGDCCSLGNRISIFTGSDDFHAGTLAGNVVPQDMVTTIKGDVNVGRAALIGAHSIIMPGVRVGDAAAVGAQSVLTQDVQAGTIVVNGSSRCLPIGRRDVAKILSMADTVVPISG